MSITKCQECGKVISTAFPLHDCSPTPNFIRNKREVESRMETFEKANPGFAKRLEAHNLKGSGFLFDLHQWLTNSGYLYGTQVEAATRIMNNMDSRKK